MRHAPLFRLASFLLLGALASCDAPSNLIGPGDARPSATVIPAPPSGVTGTAVSPWQINLSWTDGSSDETSFQVWRRNRNPDATFTAWAQVGTTGADGTQFSESGLQPNTTYQYQVRACISVCSGWAVGSGIRTPDGPPTPPTSLVATPWSPVEIRLTWNDNSRNETSFQIWRRTRFADSTSTAWAQVATAGANATGYADTGLSPSTIYQYQIRACEPTRCSPWAVSQTVSTPAGSPPAPTNLVATAVSPSQLQVTWTDQSGNEQYFRLYRRMRNADGSYTGWTQAAAVPADSTRYLDGGLLAGTGYQYQIQACNSVGCSYPWTVGALVTTPPSTVAPPSGLTATAASATQINLAWTDASSNESGFLVQRRIHNTNGTYTDWVQAGTPGANATTFSSTGLTPGVTYQFRIRACNGADCSAFALSNEVTTPGAPPAAPTNLQGTVASGTQVDLTWTDASTIETGFELQRTGHPLSGATGPQTWVPVATLPANTTHYSDTGVQPEWVYQYRIRACNETGCSAWTQSSSVIPAWPPAAPTGVSAVVRANSIGVLWTDESNNEKQFEVQRRVYNTADDTYGSWALLTTARYDLEEINDATAVRGTTYQYRVRACNTGGCSEWSAPSGHAMVQPVPAAPSGLAGTAVSSSQINVTWNDQSSNETYFQLYRRTRNPDGTYTGFSLIASPGANATGYSDTGRAPATGYQYQLRSCNLSGCSAFNISALVTTPP